MSTKTTNYGLIKPELTDPADITDMNSNWDKIDKELKDKSEEVSTLKSEFAELDAEAVGAMPSLTLDWRSYSDIKSAIQAEVANVLKNGKAGTFMVFTEGGHAYTITAFRDDPVIAGSYVDWMDETVYFRRVNDGRWFFNTIFGEHNKPSGTYVGNGTADERWIVVGGIGRFLLIKTYGHGFAILTDVGGVMVAGGASLEPISASEARYQDGKLMLKTNKSVLNQNGVAIIYTVF